MPRRPETRERLSTPEVVCNLLRPTVRACADTADFDGECDLRYIPVLGEYRLIVKRGGRPPESYTILRHAEVLIDGAYIATAAARVKKALAAAGRREK